MPQLSRQQGANAAVEEQACPRSRDCRARTLHHIRWR